MFVLEVELDFMKESLSGDDFLLDSYEVKRFGM